MTRPSRFERACPVASATLAVLLLAGCADWPSAGYAPSPHRHPEARRPNPATQTAAKADPSYRWPTYSPVGHREPSTDVSEALAISTFGGPVGRSTTRTPQSESHAALPVVRTARTPAATTSRATPPNPEASTRVASVPGAASRRVASIPESAAVHPTTAEHTAPPLPGTPIHRTQAAAASSNESYEKLLGVPLQPESGAITDDPGESVARVSFASEGADFDPDVSRDGREVVFASTQHHAAADIYVKPVHSRVVTQLTSDPAQDLMPKFSPDGSRIAFASNRNGNWDIFVMPSDGGRAVQVTDTTAHELHPSWSPDGTRLIFCRLGGVSGHWEMWVTDAGNAGLSQFVGYGMFPEWCPVTGTGEGGADRVLFQRSRQRGDRSFAIWTIDLHGGDVRNATEIASSTTAACINPAWSPDGRWFTYATVPNAGAWMNSPASRPPSAELWMADLNGAARVKLTSGGALALMPAWGADRIYFVSDRGGSDNIWSLDARSAVDLASAMIAPAGLQTDMANVPDQPTGDPGHE